MSALLMGRVFYTDLPANLKLTLLAMVDHAADDGTRMYAGQKLLAQKVGCSDRTIRRAVEDLEVRGFLIPEPRRGSHGTNHYRLNLNKLRPDITMADRPNWPTGQIEQIPRVDRTSAAPRPDTAMSGKPSEEPSEKKQSPCQAKPDGSRELLEYVNTVGRTHYQPVEANLKLIRARLREYDEYSLAAMVRRQWHAWKGTDMVKFFRPATLFGAEKCAQYVGQLPDADRAWVAKKLGATP